MSGPERGPSIGGAAALGVVAGALNILAGIVRSKVTAVVLGPTGIGKTAEIFQLATMANLPATMVAGPTLLSSIAEATRDADEARTMRITRTATTVVLLASSLGALVATLAGVWLLPSPWGHGAWPLTLLGGLALLFSAWLGVPVQLLTARGALGRLTAVRVVVSLLGAALVIAGTVAFDLAGQFVAMAFAAAAGVAVAFLMIPGVRAGWRPTASLDRPYLRRALELGVTTLLTGAATQATLFTFRWSLEAHGGPALNGQFQAAWTIGSVYFALVLDSLGTYVFPRYAAAKDSKELAQEIDGAARFLFRMAPPLVALGIVFRTPVVRLLYSHRFDEAIDLLGLLMVGDIAKGIAWVQGGPLLYRHRVRALLFSEVAAACAHVAGALILVPRLGLLGLGYVVVGVNVAYAVLGAFVTSVSCGVEVKTSRLLLVVAATAGAFALLLVSRQFQPVRWVVLAGALVWWARIGAFGAIRARAARLKQALRNGRE